MPDQAPGASNHAPLNGGHWKCSEKQKGLILRLVDEHKLDKHQVEALAVERFGHGVCALGKLEASGLIDELLEAHEPRGGARPRQNAYSGNRKGGRQ